MVARCQWCHLARVEVYGGRIQGQCLHTLTGPLEGRLDSKNCLVYPRSITADAAKDMCFLRDGNNISRPI